MFSWSKNIFSNAQSRTPLQKDASVSQWPKDTTTSSLTPKIRIVFMGTPDFSAKLLESLIENGYNIVGVVTKAERGLGRKNELTEIPVKTVALKHNLPLIQPEKFDVLAKDALQKWKPDLIIVAAYGKILPNDILLLPGFGCINVHASLLPKLRGASPIQNALLSGATESGITLMLMDTGMDTGDILAQKTVPIAPDDTTPTLTDKLLMAGKELLHQTLPLFIERQITPIKQDNSKATLCQLIEREDGRIIWSDDALSIYNRFRALSPWPGIFTYWRKNDNLLRLKLISVSYQSQNPEIIQPLGKVFEIGEKIGVQTTTGILFLEQVQLEGKEPLPIREFLLGNESLLNSLLE